MKPREAALDALRGWAILGMALSGMLPWGSLPGWMYHRQLEPPGMKLNPERFGLTWVDWVFPFFIFAMGAAIPLAREASVGRIVLRGLGIGALAIAVEHLRSSAAMADRTWLTWSLLWFVGMACFFLRWDRLPIWAVAVLRGVGVGIVGYGLWQAGELSGKIFDPSRQDSILMSLAQVSITAGLTWKLAQRWIGWLAVVPGLFFLFWVLKPEFWNWTPAPWAFRFEYQKYLIVAAAGMAFSHFRDRWQPYAGGLGLAGLCLLASDETRIFQVLLLSGAVALLVERVYRKSWWLAGAAGVFGVVYLAHLLEPSLRKDPTSWSYLLLTPALAALVWSALRLRDPAPPRGPESGGDLPAGRPLEESESHWTGDLPVETARAPGFVAAVGMNPILGYIVITNLIPAGIRLTGLHGWVGNQGWSPWSLAAYAGFLTLLVGLVTMLATRVRIWVRA